MTKITCFQSLVPYLSMHRIYLIKSYNISKLWIHFFSIQCLSLANSLSICSVSLLGMRLMISFGCPCFCRLSYAFHLLKIAGYLKPITGHVPLYAAITFLVTTIANIANGEFHSLTLPRSQ